MRVLRWTKIVVATVGVALAGGHADADDSPPKGNEQIWEGTLKVRPGIELRLVIHAKLNDGGEPIATLDSPDEELRGLTLSSVVIDRTRLAFDLAISKAKYDGKVNSAGTEATGTWTQGGGVLPLTFVKKDKVTPEPKIVGDEEIWEGKLGLGAGLELRLVVRVRKTEDGRVLGKFESPDQGAAKLKMDSVTLDKTTFAFAMKGSSMPRRTRRSGRSRKAA
jgi:uncharacterized protein